MMTPRALVGTLLVAGLAYAVPSMRHLDAPDRQFVVDSTLPGTAPRLLEPGWHFVPRLVSRIASYPASPVKLRVDLSGDRATICRDGTKVNVEAELTYSIPPEGVLALHAARGPGYEPEWLSGILEQATTARLAAVSYDVVRDRDPELVQGVRGVLDQQLPSEGLQIARLRISETRGVDQAAGPILQVRAGRPDRDVVLIGVDSFDWRIIDPLMKRGKMPNLKRLVARGARANLKTIRPILSPVIWTSLATGMKPSRHGIVDFVVTGANGETVPVTSAMRKVPALWNLLSRQEIDVSVVAWWATWPAETVRGRMVTDRVAYQLFENAVERDWKSDDPARNKGKTFPIELIDELRPLIKAPAEVTDKEIAWFLPGGRFPKSMTAEQREMLDRFRTVIAGGETYHAIAMNLFRSSDSKLKMVYYEGPDTTSHLFMHYRPPLLPGTARTDMDLFGRIIDRYYERQDRFIGEIVEQAGDDATIILVSDHGFKSEANRPPHSDPNIGKGEAARWHTPVGVLVMAGPEIRRGLDLDAATVLDVAPTILSLYGLPVARDMDGQPLTEAFSPAYLESHPVAWIDSFGGHRRPGEGIADIDTTLSADDEQLLEKLRSLGYIGTDRNTAHNNRGTILLDEGDIEGAIAEFQTALKSGAEAGTMIRTNLARAWLLNGDLEKARARAEQVLGEDPGNQQAELILAGVELADENDDAAEVHLRRALALDPTDVQARMKLGLIQKRRGDHDAALAELSKVVEIEPLNSLAYSNIGSIYRKTGQIDRAIESYREALRTDVQSIGAYNNLGLCLQEQGRLDEAKELYEKALAIRPENSVLLNSLGTVIAAQGDRKAAMAQFERAVASNPNWPVAQGNLATLFFETGRFEEASAAFERVVALEPESVESRLGLALSYLMVQDRTAAVEQFDEVLARDPDNLRAHIALGETLLREGDLEKAQRHLEQAAGLEGRIPRVLNSLGEVYLRRGLKNEAARAFEESLSIDPAQEAIRRRYAEAGDPIP